MFFLVLFVGVFLFLTGLAWRFPAQWPRLVGMAGMTGQGDAQGHAQPRADNAFARLLQGERKEDKPCVTPVDCVQTGRCAGHCGCH